MRRRFSSTYKLNQQAVDARLLQKASGTPFKWKGDNVLALMDMDGPSSPGKWTAQMAAALVHFLDNVQ